MSTQVPLTTDAPARTVYSFAQMYDTGLLWLINRVVFHPRGFALAIEGGTDGNAPQGWSLQAAQPGEAMSFDLPDGFEDERFRAIEAVLAEARQHGCSPATAHPAFFVPVEETPAS